MTRTIVTTSTQAESLIKRLNNSDLVGFDTESSGPLLLSQRDPNKTRDFVNMYRATLTGCSFAFEGHSSFYMPVSHRKGRNAPSQAVRGVLKAMATHPTIVAHNVKHELLALSSWISAETWNWVDTQIQYWLLQKSVRGKYGLKSLASQYLSLEMLQFNEATGGRSFDELTPEEGLGYACEDAEAALSLWTARESELDIHPGMKEAFYKREMPFVRVLRHIEDTGMAVDCDRFQELADNYTEQLVPLLEEWEFITGGINPRSSKQLQWFFESGEWTTNGIPRTKTGFSTAKEWVEYQLRSCKKGSIGSVAAELKLRISLLSKLVSTYTTKMIHLSGQYPDGRLHCNLLHTGAATGRLSSSYPNLQNIPVRTEEGSKLLTAFKSPNQRMLSADYSQIELRVLAHLAGGSLEEAYKRGEDVHQQTADLLGIDRFAGKTVNFAVIYGATASRIMRLLGVSRKKGNQIITNYWSSRPEVSKWRNSTIKFARDNGYVATIGGRIRDLSTVENYSFDRVAGNTPIQGGARDIVTQAMVNIYSRLKRENLLDEIQMCGQVHDDIIGYTTKDREDYAKSIFKEEMENAWSLTVPLITEPVSGDSWKDLK